MSELHGLGQCLIDTLEKRRDDRGFMAELRRGLHADTEHRAWAHVASWCDLTNARQRTIYATVMGSFAFHPQHRPGTNLGVTLRRIARGQAGEEGLRSFEARFRRILTCDTAEEVCRLMRYVIRAASAKGVPVDYVTLFADLIFWGERVKLRWARGYWSTPEVHGGEEG